MAKSTELSINEMKSESYRVFQLLCPIVLNINIYTMKKITPILLEQGTGILNENSNSRKSDNFSCTKSKQVPMKISSFKFPTTKPRWEMAAKKNETQHTKMWRANPCRNVTDHTGEN